MGEKDFQKFMKTLARILGITGETSVCFNRVSSGAIMVGPVITAAKDVSCEHKDLTKLAFGEGISVKVGLDGGNIEQILQKAYEDNEFRFDWPEHVLIQLKTDAVGISSPKFQEFKIGQEQVHRLVTFFAPGVTLEEVQKVMEAMQLSEKRK